MPRLRPYAPKDWQHFFALELDKVLVGFLKSVDGGNATAEVVVEAPLSYYSKKHIANVKYEEKVHGPMAKRGIWPQRIKVLCSDTELGIRALLTDPTGKARAFAPVPPIQGSPAIAVRVEESILNNATHTMFAGKKFTGEELDKEFNTLLKTVRPALKE